MGEREDERKKENVCAYVHYSNVGGEAVMGGRQEWFGKSYSIEIKKAKLIVSQNSIPLEASQDSSGKD